MSLCSQTERKSAELLPAGQSPLHRAPPPASSPPDVSLLLPPRVAPPHCDASRPPPRILSEHPWKPLTLAAYPRPEGSRSNYGAVERILKHYESAARAQHHHHHHHHHHHQQQQESQLSVLSLQSVGGSEQDPEPSWSPRSGQRSFSRPARPARRRLPSRWAARSAASSSSSPSPSPSPSSSPAGAPSLPLQRHASSFTCSHAFHMETVII